MLGAMNMSPLQGWDAGWIPSYRHIAPTALPTTHVETCIHS
jgi:hypothetical protein